MGKRYGQLHEHSHGDSLTAVETAARLRGEVIGSEMIGACGVDIPVTSSPASGEPRKRRSNVKSRQCCFMCPRVNGCDGRRPGMRARCVLTMLTVSLGLAGCGGDEPPPPVMLRGHVVSPSGTPIQRSEERRVGTECRSRR